MVFKMYLFSMYACVICMCIHIQGPNADVGCHLLLLPTLFFETEFLIESNSGHFSYIDWLTSSRNHTLFLPIQHCDNRHIPLLFIRLLGIRTQILILVQQELHPLSAQSPLQYSVYDIAETNKQKPNK